jgi:NAD-dependent deacetylase
LAELEGRIPSFTLVTQNIDGLHQAAGSREVVELHGSILRARCEGCGGRSDLGDGEGDGVPACPGCGGRLRPDVVWFGEQLPEEVLTRAFASAGEADLFLVAGTSALVQPAASLPLLALRSGARLLEVNLEETPLTPRADVSLRGRTGELLPMLEKALT